MIITALNIACEKWHNKKLQELANHLGFQKNFWGPMDVGEDLFCWTLNLGSREFEPKHKIYISTLIAYCESTQGIWYAEVGLLNGLEFPTSVLMRRSK